MKLVDYYAMRRNRYKRKCVVHCERENDWFKTGSSFTVLGLDENFTKAFRESHLSMAIKDFDGYCKLKESEFKKVVESLELGRGTDKYPMVGYAFQ